MLNVNVQPYLEELVQAFADVFANDLPAAKVKATGLVLFSSHIDGWISKIRVLPPVQRSVSDVATLSELQELSKTILR